MADVPESSSTTSPAQTRVLATPELLELIYLFLDPIALFAIQRVCKQWKALIADSHRLQEHMFLRAPACHNENKPETSHQPSETQCSTAKILTNHGAENRYYFYDNDTDNDDPIPITLNPILTPATQFIQTHPNQLAVTCSQTSLNGHPSWHEMHLSFPPCKSATAALWWTLGDSMRGSVYLESLDGRRHDDGGGLRFRDVIEAALAMKTGKVKSLPDGKLMPLSAVGGDVNLGGFLEGVVLDGGGSLEATSLVVLSF